MELESVPDDDAHVAGAPVLDLGQYGEPEFGSLAAATDPQSEDVAVAIDGHPDCHVDGPVDDLSVSGP